MSLAEKVLIVSLFLSLKMKTVADYKNSEKKSSLHSWREVHAHFQKTFPEWVNLKGEKLSEDTYKA
jgi:hypothetical protein